MRERSLALQNLAHNEHNSADQYGHLSTHEGSLGQFFVLVGIVHPANHSQRRAPAAARPTYTIIHHPSPHAFSLGASKDSCTSGRLVRFFQRRTPLLHIHTHSYNITLPIILLFSFTPARQTDQACCTSSHFVLYCTRASEEEAPWDHDQLAKENCDRSFLLLSLYYRVFPPPNPLPPSVLEHRNMQK